MTLLFQIEMLPNPKQSSCLGVTPSSNHTRAPKVCTWKPKCRRKTAKSLFLIRSSWISKNGRLQNSYSLKCFFQTKKNFHVSGSLPLPSVDLIALADISDVSKALQTRLQLKTIAATPDMEKLGEIHIQLAQLGLKMGMPKKENDRFGKRFEWTKSISCKLLLGSSMKFHSFKTSMSSVDNVPAVTIWSTHLVYDVRNILGIWCKKFQTGKLDHSETTVWPIMPYAACLSTREHLLKNGPGMLYFQVQRPIRSSSSKEFAPCAQPNNYPHNDQNWPVALAVKCLRHVHFKEKTFLPRL